MLEELLVDVAAETHYEVAVTAPEYVQPPSVQEIKKETKPIDSSLLICRCPVCKQNVGAKRFAQHLEKCMKGGRRHQAHAKVEEVKKKSSNGTNPLDASGIDVSFANYYQSWKRRRPNIVRVAMKDGGESGWLRNLHCINGECYIVPISNQSRKTVPFTEFYIINTAGQLQLNDGSTGTAATSSSTISSTPSHPPSA